MFIRPIMLALTTLTVAASAQVINEDLKLTPSDGASGDFFGSSIAYADGVVGVGTNLDDNDTGNFSGSVYLFDASTGAQLFKLLPSDGAAYDQFGISIAISDGVVAVGAYYDDDNGSESGSAYLFDASTGVQIDKLLPSDGAEDDEFGGSIAIDNGVVAVGAKYNDTDNGASSGSAYLFDASTGEQLFKLLPNDGAAGDRFGISIAIADGVVAVGATGDDDNGSFSGSAYVFDAATGIQIAKLLPSDGVAGDKFGHSIALDNGVVVVGAINGSHHGIRSGSAYVFDAATGVLIAKLLPSDGATDDVFGESIAIADGVVAVGARDNGSDSGSAYVFDASTGEPLFKLLSSDGDDGDTFGVSIAIADGIVAVGAMGDDDNGGGSGSAYVFDTVVAPCPADLTGDGELNFFDVSGFLVLFQLNYPIADFNNDNRWNFFDVSAFLQAFAAGCP